MSLKKQWLDMLEKVLGVMKEIEKENIKAYHWLDNLDPATWTRSKFSPRVKCDMLTNNPCESWNKYIVEARNKPILIMLEMRRMVMKRIQVKKEVMDKQKCKVSP